MRILMLGWELAPVTTGGLGIASYQLCKALSESGADIDFVIPYYPKNNVGFMNVISGNFDGYRNSTGGLVGSYDTSIWGERQRSSTLDSYEKMVEEVAKSKQFDLIHAHDWLTFRVALRAKEITGAPLIVHAHSIESDRAGGNLGNPLVREIEETTFLLADRIIAVSDFTRNAIHRDYGIPIEKIEVVHNSIDTSELKILERDNVYRYITALKKQGYKVVVSVSRMTVQKNLNVLIKAAKEILAFNPKTIFILVGGGEQYQELIEQSAGLGILRNIIFTGIEFGRPARDAFRIGDVFVMPSISEPFGITPLEAGFYGTPSIISKQAGVSEILSNCLKIDYWDSNELANKVVAIIQNDTLRNTLTSNLDNELANTTWQKSADKVMNIYSEQQAAIG